LNIGGGGRTRTYDLRIMSRQPADDSKEFQQDSSADSGKVPQNPHPPAHSEGAATVGESLPMMRLTQIRDRA